MCLWIHVCACVRVCTWACAHTHICSLSRKTIPFSLTKTWSWRQSHGPGLEVEPESTELEEMRSLLVKDAQYFLTSMKDCYQGRQSYICWISVKLFYLIGRWDWKMLLWFNKQCLRCTSPIWIYEVRKNIFQLPQLFKIMYWNMLNLDP